MVTFLPEIDEMDSNPVRSGESGFAVSQSSAEEKQALPPTVPPVQSAPATVSEVTRRAPPAQNVTGNRPADSASAVAASPAFSGLSNYWETVRAAVARSVRYPSVAVREGIEGTIALRLTLDTQGNLVEAVPLEGSSDILVQSALGAARRAAPFPMPTVCSESGPSAILPIHFQLRQ